MNRDATKSMNGYSYQRLCALYYLTKYYNDNNITILKEEGDEDVDLFVNNDDNKEIIQIKFYDSKDKETISQESGIFKVISSHVQNHSTINKITMYVYQKNNEPYTKIIAKWIDAIKNNNNDELEFIILTYIYFKIKGVIKCECSDKKDCACDYNIIKNIKQTEINNINNITNIKNISSRTKDNIFDMYEKNKNQWIIFFKKFNFEEGMKVVDLEKEIDKNLNKIYIDGNNLISKDNIDLKIDLLRCKYYNSLVQNGFDGNKKINIKTFMNNIKNEVKNVLLYDNDILITNFYESFKCEIENDKVDKNYVYGLFYNVVKKNIENNITFNNKFIKNNLYELYKIRKNDKLDEEKKRYINLLISYIYLSTYIYNNDKLEYNDVIVLVGHSQRILKNDSIKEDKPSTKIKQIIEKIYKN